LTIKHEYDEMEFTNALYDYATKATCVPNLSFSSFELNPKRRLDIFSRFAGETPKGHTGGL